MSFPQAASWPLRKASLAACPLGIIGGKASGKGVHSVKMGARRGKSVHFVAARALIFSSDIKIELFPSLPLPLLALKMRR